MGRKTVSGSTGPALAPGGRFPRTAGSHDRREPRPAPGGLDPQGATMGSETLGELELLVMLAALRLGPQGANAISIAEEIEERTGRKVRRATVHSALRKLEGKVFVSMRPAGDIGDKPPGGAERRPDNGATRHDLVKVEPAGVAAVRATTEGILAMMGKRTTGDAG